MVEALLVLGGVQDETQQFFERMVSAASCCGRRKRKV